MFLTDSQWLLLRPLFPSASRGRPPADARLVLNNILWKLLNNQPWYDIPSQSPTWQTCYQHYRRWKNTGTWKSIINILMLDLHERGGLDLQQALKSHAIIFTRDHSGQVYTDCSPHLKDTWQFSTAVLLLMMLTSDL